VIEDPINVGDFERLAEEKLEPGVVSNHGGRQLDRCLSTADALPEAVDAVDGRGAVLVDGGIRRGVDIAIALALGADAVLVGRTHVRRPPAASVYSD
jgi:isopentenyl diphosphate isomerase/L-lactate dehydrogenase-like FMN-dependent dehydrogenase